MKKSINKGTIFFFATTALLATFVFFNDVRFFPEEEDREVAGVTGAIDFVGDVIGGQTIGKDPHDLEREAREQREAIQNFRNELDEKERRERDKQQGEARDKIDRETGQKPRHEQPYHEMCKRAACG